MSPPTRSTEGQALGFEEFVELHQVSLRRFALALTGNPHDADDLLQDTLVKLYLAWHRLEDHADLRAYARTTLARTAVSSWRRWGRRVTPTATVPDAPAPAGPDLAEQDLVWRALEQLGRRQRAVVVLRYYEDLDLASIAETLGISVGTAKSQSPVAWPTSVTRWKEPHHERPTRHRHPRIAGPPRDRRPHPPPQPAPDDPRRLGVPREPLRVADRQPPVRPAARR
ncbi:MAG: SigE family RNA polymerase sigma factor [Propioniciclava sp.]|nr:SigE family RNA polymerase sigma factor [Propioniciclava sp.]